MARCQSQTTLDGLHRATIQQQVKAGQQRGVAGKCLLLRKGERVSLCVANAACMRARSATLISIAAQTVSRRDNVNEPSVKSRFTDVARR